MAEKNAYEKGYEEGQKGFFLTDVADSFGDIIPDMRDPGYAKSYDEGYSDGSQDRGSNDDSGKSDSCCYITTACLDAMSLPRNSLEMRAMKVLTKEYILKSFQGKKDYILYGRKAPAIVQAIDARDDSQNVWNSVYRTLRDITSTVLSGDYEKAHKQYKDLVLGLENNI